MEVKLRSCYGLNLYAMFSMVWSSLYSSSVVRFNVWVQPCVSCVTICSTIPVFILHSLLQSNSLDQRCQSLWSKFPEMLKNFLQKCMFLFFCTGQNFLKLRIFLQNFLKTDISAWCTSTTLNNWSTLLIWSERAFFQHWKSTAPTTSPNLKFIGCLLV